MRAPPRKGAEYSLDVHGPPPKPIAAAIAPANDRKRRRPPASLAGVAHATAAFFATRWPARDRLLLAVSGGTDSTALAVVVAHLRLQGGGPADCVVAHVDHGLHATSTDAAARVRALAARLQIPHLERRLPRDTGRSEAALREARYAALQSMARACGATAVCTAHTADDQIETVLFRAVRGTGPLGLAGIPPVRRLAQDLLLLRPFLAVRRQTLTQLLADLGEPAFEDPTNADRRYTRNRLRHDVLPGLRARVDGFDARVLALAERARQVTDVTTKRAQAWLADSGRRCTAARFEVSLDAATPMHLRCEILRLAHQRLRPGGSAPWSWIERAAALVDHAAGTRVTGPRCLLAERLRNGVLLVDAECCGSPPATSCDLGPGTVVRFGDTEWSIEASRPGAAPPPANDRRHAVIDAGIGELRLRCRRPGDRFRPTGMAQAVELRRFLQARHVPRFDRDRLPLVVDAGDRVVWVPGVAIAATAAVSAATRDAVLLRLHCG